jgi:hypothetical protein
VRQSAGESTKLAVILSQYDRERFKDALPRLLAVIDGLDDVDATFVVVDNRESGDWSHTVSGRLHHIGGDNSAREFSAFDRGVHWIVERGPAPDLFVLVTDAFVPDSDELAPLIDDHVVRWSRSRSSCIGWVDSFMEPCEILGHACDAWMRTSFVFLPREVMPLVSPLAYPLEEAMIFGPTADEPFRTDAPISENLRELLLEWLTTNPRGPRRRDEAWHSRFELDETSFQLFKEKTCAILREMFTSARLRAAGVAVYDFRCIRGIQASKQQGLSVSDNDLQAWQWLGWRRAGFHE